ncbi:hypothetical protein E4U58_000750 [Claviceps cyperi]|nr:hypothetical protein E4U58_000750 [Claviceps cyperi]
MYLDDNFCVRDLASTFQPRFSRVAQASHISMINSGPWSSVLPNSKSDDADMPVVRRHIKPALIIDSARNSLRGDDKFAINAGAESCFYRCS